ncbi:mechanosensitive ion channel domain-containing protein [Novosphingobium sp.]|uniref:mechanosensitive ion channel family protein n=1 Tax=Novosphingobium sp. TaxID=1874826 RepID=UPI0025DDEA8A|nr:mechanosensitive ion channel domain-containing protein [Novosphingobium sp.]MCC6925137.1 mechanosensitive ion channel [Novosphingobium sp.]
MSLKHDIAQFTARLDAIGFDVGNYHVSLYRALLMVVTVVAVIVLGRLAGYFFRRLFARMHRLDATQKVLGEKLATIAAWIVLALSGIDFLGIDLTALAFFSGALGLAIGFGLQKTFGNLISGLILLADRSIKPGDVIAVGTGADKTVGQVNRIGIRAVSVITRDQVEYLIPNELLMTNQVENWSFTSKDVRVKVKVPVAYGTDIELAEQLILAEVRKIQRVINRQPPQAWLSEFGDSAIVFEVQMWIADPEEGLGNLRSDLLKGVWKAFQANGIQVPFPQRDLHIKEWPGKPDGES